MAHILVSDDERGGRESLQILLEQKHEVLTCVGGTYTLATLDQKPCDLLITDLCNPHMDGRDLIAEVRKRLPELPVIVASGSDPMEPTEYDQSTIDLTTELAQAGVRAFVRRPFDVDAMLRAIQYALDSQNSASMRTWT